METKVKSASVKVMRSYDYNHFETSMVLENEDGVSNDEINGARKECMRLCDKAIAQYQMAKKVEQQRINLSSQKSTLTYEVNEIKKRDETTWSVVDKAKVKTLADHDWNLRFDYEDDFEPNW